MKSKAISKIFLAMIGVLVLVGAGVAAILLGVTPASSQSSQVEDQADLVEALSANGMVVESGGTLEPVVFSVEAQIIKVNGEDVQVLEYETEETMLGEAGAISPDGTAIGTSMVTWMATPHFYMSGRIIVLYVGDSTALLDSFDQVLGEQFAGG